MRITVAAKATPSNLARPSVETSPYRMGRPLWSVEYAMQGRIAEHLMNFAERLADRAWLRHRGSNADLFLGGVHSSSGRRSALMWRKLVLRSMSPSLSILRVRLVTRACSDSRRSRATFRAFGTARPCDRPLRRRHLAGGFASASRLLSPSEPVHARL